MSLLEPVTSLFTVSLSLSVQRMSSISEIWRHLLRDESLWRPAALWGEELLNESEERWRRKRLLMNSVWEKNRWWAACGGRGQNKTDDVKRAMVEKWTESLVISPRKPCFRGHLNVRLCDILNVDPLCCVLSFCDCVSWRCKFWLWVGSDVVSFVLNVFVSFFISSFLFLCYYISD